MPTIFLSVCRYGLLAQVVFEGDIPPGLEAFGSRDGHAVRVDCWGEAAGEYDWMPARVACDYCRDHGRDRFEPWSGTPAAHLVGVLG